MIKKAEVIYIPEGAEKTVQIGNALVAGGFLSIEAHVSRHASFVIDEYLEIDTTCTIRLAVALEGEGASYLDKSRYRAYGGARVDIERTVAHRAPDTVSRVEAKGILLDAAHSIWRGRIRVEIAAKRARAFQRHDALLDGTHVLADVAPFLEIFTNDVACKHGASVQRLKPEHLYYLQSRGIAEEHARDILLKGFLV